MMYNGGKTFEIDDPSDWPKEFSVLKILDSLLRCSICSEYFNIAVIVPKCSHNYCSACIRKHITKKNNCPTCGVELYDTDIKPNRVLDELVIQFRQVRKHFLKCPESSTLTLIEQMDDEHEQVGSQEKEFEQPTTFRQPRSLKKKPAASSQASVESKQEPVRSGIQVCPNCSSIEHETTINMHLDACLSERPKKQREFPPPHPEGKVKRRKEENASCSSASTNISCVSEEASYRRRITKKKGMKTANDLITSSFDRQLKPLPKMCFDALNEKQLKKKLKDVGLPMNGDRSTLTSRLKNYYLLYNAQSDSAKPMNAADVAKQVVEEEKNLTHHGYKPETRKEKIKPPEEYLKENDVHFKRLIQDVETRNHKVTKISTDNTKQSKIFTEDHVCENDKNKEPTTTLFNEKYVFDIVCKTEDDEEDEEIEETSRHFETENMKRKRKTLKLNTNSNSAKESSGTNSSTVRNSSSTNSNNAKNSKTVQPKKRQKTQKNNNNNNKHNKSVVQPISSFFSKKDSTVPTKATPKKRATEKIVEPGPTTISVPDSDSSSDENISTSSLEYIFEEIVVPESPILFDESVKYTPERSTLDNWCRSGSKEMRTVRKNGHELNSTSIPYKTPSSPRETISRLQTELSPISGSPRNDNNADTVTRKSFSHHTNTRRTLYSEHFTSRVSPHKNSNSIKSSNNNNNNNNNSIISSSNNNNNMVEEHDFELSHEINNLVEDAYETHAMSKVTAVDSDSDVTLSDNDIDMVPKPPPCEFSFSSMN